VPERLAYPSSILGKEFSRFSTCGIDLIVEVELARRAASGRSHTPLFLLAKLPYKLEPGVTEDVPHSVSMRELPHCHAISGPLFPPSAMSARYFGGGSGGGTGSLAFGIDIGPEEVEGDEIEVVLLGPRNRSDGFESWTQISGRASGLAPR
jgi:hypothetical protein